MQRIVFIGAILFAAAFAVQGDCPSYSCLKTGDSCAAPCGNCFTDLGTCYGANFGNAPGICGCLNTALTCINARADAATCQMSLKAFSTALPSNCTTQAGDNCTACATIAGYANPPKIGVAKTCNLNTDYCNANKVCAAQLAPGATCAAGDVCVPFYTCKAGTCQRAGISLANDLCNNNTDCIGTLNCTGGICQGRVNGSACTQNGECNPGLYCNLGVCNPYLAAGAACQRLPEACGLAGTCGSASTCVTAYSAAAGAACSALSFPSECTFGTNCDNAVCTAAGATIACYNNTDCTVAGTTCTCGLGRTDGKGTCSPSPINNANLAQCTTQATALLTCLTTKNCRQNTPDSMTCVGTKCQAEITAYTTCATPSIYSTLCAVPTSAATGNNGGSAGASGTTTSDASSLCGAAAVLLGAAALL